MTLFTERAFKRLVYISDTGLLSTFSQMYVVTPKFMDSCAADKVQISVILNTKDIK